MCCSWPRRAKAAFRAWRTIRSPVAVNNNPLLSRLAAVVTATGLDDMLNEGPLTVFAPINSAFDKVDPATLEGLLADTDVLTGVLTHHVIPAAAQYSRPRRGWHVRHSPWSRRRAHRLHWWARPW